MHSPISKKGFSVVEIIVASAIIVTLVSAIGGGWQLYLKVTRDGTHFTMASNLSEEGAEAIQLLRDLSWDSHIASLSLNTPYDLYWTGATYAATTTPQLIQSIYRRTVNFSAVQRDAWDNIVSSGGTTDSNTRKATISIYLGSTSTAPISQSEMLIHNTYAN